MLKRLSDYKLIEIDGSLDGTPVTSAKIDSELIGKSFVIEKIIPQFFYVDPLTSRLMNLTPAQYDRIVQGQLRINFYINGALQPFLYQLPIGNTLENLFLFVEELQSVSFDGVIETDTSGTPGYLSITLLIYGYTTNETFVKTKLKMSYDN